MAEHEALSPTDLALLGKVAAVVHDESLLDYDSTSPAVINLLWRCSEAYHAGRTVTQRQDGVVMIRRLIAWCVPTHALQWAPLTLPSEQQPTDHDAALTEFRRRYLTDKEPT